VDRTGFSGNVPLRSFEKKFSDVISKQGFD
jgi:hypothetical protein